MAPSLGPRPLRIYLYIFWRHIPCLPYGPDRPYPIPSPPGQLQDPLQWTRETLGLSVNAVHKRIKSMVADGVIRAFTAKVSLSALGAFPMLI